MKNFTLTLITILTATLAVALSGSESIYEGPSVSYSVEKASGEVIINLDMIDPAQYDEIKIVRSDNPVKYFRQVKILSGEKISELSGSDELIDKYPLPGKTTSYYKVITVDNTGVQKSYPSVKLSLR